MARFNGKAQDKETQGMVGKPIPGLQRLIGKPVPGKRYKLCMLPPVIELLKHFDMDTVAVYDYYDTLVNAGWVNPMYVDKDTFKTHVRACRKQYLGSPDNYTTEFGERRKDEYAMKPRYESAAEEHDELYSDDADESDGYRELMAKDDEINYLRKQVRDLTKDIRKRRESDYMGKLVVAELKEALTNCVPDRFNIKVDPSIMRKASNGGFHNILPISDAHFGEVVSGSEINGLNHYNMAISKRRHIELFKRNYEYACMFGCRDLHIFFLGDIFSGNIHDELRESNERPVLVCVAEYYKFITGLILEYAKLYDNVSITCVVGNHARNTQRYQFKNKSVDNYEYILYDFMKTILEAQADNIKVNVGKSVVAFADVGKQVWKLEHGDRYKGGSAFVSPLSTCVRDNFKDYAMYMGKATVDADARAFDATIIGHWHIGGEWYLQGSSIPIYFNPSLIGPGEFAVNNIHSSYPAESLVLITDGEKVVSTTKVNLMHIQEG